MQILSIRLKASSFFSFNECIAKKEVEMSEKVVAATKNDDVKNYIKKTFEITCSFTREVELFNK
jgi:hypothetical protein